MTTTIESRPLSTRSVAAARRYRHQIAGLLVAAFALSATHTTYGWVTGIGDPRFTVTTPIAWVFYAVGFASAWLALKESAWARRLLLGYLAVLLWVSLFYYPTTFVPKQQTTFGWFENDVYTGLLMIAAYLGVSRELAARGADAGS